MNPLDFTLTKLILLAYTITLLATLYHVRRSSKQKVMKIAWGFIIVVIPLIGSFLYIFNEMFLVESNSNQNINYSNNFHYKHK